jgi:hypothetical protein
LSHLLDKELDKEPRWLQPSNEAQEEQEDAPKLNEKMENNSQLTRMGFPGHVECHDTPQTQGLSISAHIKRPYTGQPLPPGLSRHKVNPGAKKDTEGQIMHENLSKLPKGTASYFEACLGSAVAGVSAFWLHEYEAQRCARDSLSGIQEQPPGHLLHGVTTVEPEIFPITSVLLAITGYSVATGRMYYCRRHFQYLDHILCGAILLGVIVGGMLGLDPEGILLGVLPWPALGVFISVSILSLAM